MGGKTSTTSSGVSIPPAVLASYETANNAAQSAANTPFSTYSGTGTSTSDAYDSSNDGTFVAPVNSQQATGGALINASANQAQPYYASAASDLNNAQAGVNPVNSAAEGLTAQSAGAVNAGPLGAQQINQYMSPYLQDVVGSESALLNQNNQQQQSGQLGTAISSGAFGGDRTGLAAANLEQQQNLSNANIYSNLLNTGYNNALSTAQQQQGVNLSASQANRTAEQSAGAQLASIGSTAYGEGANTSSSEAALGAGAQSAGLAGANAQLAYGTLEQQTQQASDTANYNQFEQQQSYPFQTAGFEAGVAEGVGSLEGSNTTTTQPGGFFSDERLKEDIKEIGETHDGQKIYSYKMKGDPRTRVGLLAQEVEKKHPEAVGLAAGFKTVDYEKATHEAANEKHFYRGGVVPMRRVARAGGGGTDMDSILAEQAQMYQGLAGGNKQASYVPQGSSGSHQLAVSNAPAAGPPPSGISKVNQSIGLGQKGYQAYHHFANGANPGVSGGTDPEYLDAAQSSLDSQGVGLAAPAADSSTASGLASTGAVDATAGDAAAGAAGDAAAGAGADAAAGAVAGAAGGAAADGAADAAAALAAEYAAADIGVAALAAKRGGVVRRHRDGGGGTPYEGGVAGEYGDDDGGMDIPGQAPTTHKLNAAPAAGKQPTGLQTLMDLGTQQGATSAIGGMFSNEALKRGGVARIGKDDGGALSDDSTTMDPIEVDSTAPSPVAYTGGIDPGAPMYRDAPDTPTLGDGAASKDPDVSDKGSWWDRNKGNVIPLAQGLAAMGTAKTRSLGTALATGLGAAADSYVPTQGGLATANLTQQKGRAEGATADLLQASNQVAIPALRNANTASAAMPLAPSGKVSDDPNDPMQVAYQRYAPVPTTPPDATMQQATALKLAGKVPAADSIIQTATNRAELANQQRVSKANADYQGALQTVNAPPGQANATLAKIDPQKAAQLAQNPATADAESRTYGSQLGFYAHQYSGRPGSVQNGVMVDGPTNAPVVGSDQLLTGLTAAEKQSAYNEALQPMVQGNGLPEPTYKVAGFKTPLQYVAAKDQAARVQTGQQSAPRAAGAPPPSAPTTAPRAPAPAAGPATIRQPAPATAAASAPPGSTNSPYVPLPGVRQATGAPAVIPKTATPALQKALADPEFKLPALPAIKDQQTRDAAVKQQAKDLENADKLKSDSDNATRAASTAQQYIKAAQAVLASKGAPVTGTFGGLVSSTSAAFGGLDATNYQIIAKNLSNSAIQQGAANGMSGTDSKVSLTLHDMNPSTKNTPEALRELLNTNLRSTEYTLDAAGNVPMYLQSGGDAGNYDKWLNKYDNRSQAVNAGMDTSGTKEGTVTKSKSGKDIIYQNGHWQYKPQ